MFLNKINVFIWVTGYLQYFISIIVRGYVNHNTIIALNTVIYGYLVTRLLAIRLLATHGYCVEYDYWLFTVIALNTVIALDTVIVLHDYCMVEYIYIYIYICLSKVSVHSKRHLLLIPIHSQ